MALTQVQGGMLSTGGVTPTQLDTQSQYTGFKNRIINGGMVIDQRNAGASVTVNTGIQTFSVDRWWGQGTASAGVFTMQQSSVAPTGFTNSLLVTVTTTDASLAASDLYDFSQIIEGYNVADLSFGTASASTVTLSFWVRSSVTGTFGGALGNSAVNRGYPFTFTINAANTFEYKTVTIAGDTSGTWLTNNGIGLRVYFSLGVGSTYSGTAGAWDSAFYLSATGATNLMATSGATFYVTGVQLEKGSTATSFDYRPYGTELSLCQRYYEALSANASGALSAGQFITLGVSETTTRVQPYYPFKVQKRATPSTTLSAIGTFGIRSTGSSVACSSGAFGSYSTAYAQGEFNNAGGGLVAGGCAWLTNHTGSATIEWSAEL